MCVCNKTSIFLTPCVTLFSMASWTFDMPKGESATTSKEGDGRVLACLIREKDETPDDYIQRIKNSGRGYKARWTIVTKSTDRLLQSVGKFPTPAGISHLEEASKEISAALAPIIDRLQKVMENTVKPQLNSRNSRTSQATFKDTSVKSLPEPSLQRSKMSTPPTARMTMTMTTAMAGRSQIRP